MEFVIWWANKNCTINIWQVRCHCDSLGASQKFSNNDITRWKFLRLLVLPPAVCEAQIKGGGRDVRFGCVSEDQQCTTHTQLCWWGEPLTNTARPSKFGWTQPISDNQSVCRCYKLAWEIQFFYNSPHFSWENMCVYLLLWMETNSWINRRMVHVNVKTHGSS